MDIVFGLAAVLMGLGIFAFVTSPKTSRGLDAFGEGFLPYRADTGWPRGVQEDDSVVWSWSPPDRSTDVPELVDVDGGDGPAASAVRPGRMVRGMARRRR